MNQFKNIASYTKTSMLSMGLTFILVVGQPALAEDVEIYQAVFNADPDYQDSVTNDPNVLFILDNSGSMSSFRLVQEEEIPGQGPYDPDVVYGGGSERDDRVYLYTTDMVYTGIQIKKQQNVCDASLQTFEDNPNFPVHQDKVIQWTKFSRRNYGWTVNYLQNNDNDEVFECEDDNGIHGRTNGSNRKYPRACSVGTQLCSSNRGRALYERNQEYVNGYQWPYQFSFPEMLLVDGNYHAYLAHETSFENADVDNCDSNDQILLDEATGTAYRCLQKLEIMKRALSLALVSDPDNPDNVDLSGINLGLMRFNYNTYSSNSGGTIIDAVSVPEAPTASTSDDSERTNKDDFAEKLDSMQFEGNTPLAESMYEAYRYFAGWSPYSAEHSPRISGQNTLDDDAVEDGVVGSSVTDETYLSPVTSNQCQGNYVVLLTDGLPTSDTSFNSAIGNLPNTSSCGSNCLDEMATAMKENLGVYTFTIGFDIDIDLLRDTAKNGSPNSDPADGDGYYTADSLESLKWVFSRVLGQVQAVEADSFVAPAVTVNAFNRLQNREDIYYAVFEPEVDLRWPGNVKKYKIGSEAKILDATGTDAIAEDTGFFTDDSKSFWSNEEDGASVVKGGFSGELLAPRNLFASLNTSSTAVTHVSAATIDAAAERFLDVLDSASLIGELMDLPIVNVLSDLIDSEDTAQAEEIVRWTLGQKIPISTTDPSVSNKYIAESIHSTPFVLSYGSSRSAPKDVVFLVTNQGLLHAITGQGADEPDGLPGQVGGSERWSYIPDPSLIKNLGGYYNKELDNSTEHIYGLDGEVAALVERDGSNNLSKAHLFLSQRRGGNKIFALDITNGYNTTNPVTKLWTAVGGTGDLKRLANTWAKPVVAKFPVCTGSICDIKDVVVVGGGYDNDYDSADTSLADLSDDTSGQDTMGNAVYVLDAATGAVLWSASNKTSNIRNFSGAGDVVVSEMDHSIPSAPLVLDLDKDGVLDAIFAVDIAGQIFRFDFSINPSATSMTATGARIANLQETGVNRRFYNPLDGVVLPRTTSGSSNRLALVTGSGYRAHPLTDEGFNNRFYVIYDENLATPAAAGNGQLDYKYVSSSSGGSESIITPSVLSEVDSTTGIDPASTNKYGYYVSLVDGTTEKVINPTLIADYQAIGVSYKPSIDRTNLCASSVGNSQAYRLDLLNGDVETIALEKPGVSAAPVLVDILEVDANSGAESLKPIVIIGTEPFKGKESFGLIEKNLGKAKKSAWWEKGRGYVRD